jgi:hypothetical protein
MGVVTAVRTARRAAILGSNQVPIKQYQYDDVIDPAYRMQSGYDVIG